MNEAKKKILQYLQEARDKFNFPEDSRYILLDVIDGCNDSSVLSDKQLEFVTQHSNAVANAIKCLESDEKTYRIKMASIALATYINSCS